MYVRKPVLTYTSGGHTPGTLVKRADVGQAVRRLAGSSYRVAGTLVELADVGQGVVTEAQC